LLHVPQKILKFIVTCCPTERLQFRHFRFRCTTPLEMFVTARFRMTIVSLAASSRSLNFATREMYKLSSLTTLFIASFNQ
jgi:hypothetical protein